MECENCSNAVKKALMHLPGVEDVNVDLPTGKVEISHSLPLDTKAVNTAIEDAGFDISDVAA
jgi:copper chaperone CopZ